MTAVRPARVDDADELLALIHEFAAFDARPERVRVTADGVRALIAAGRPKARFFVAETDGPVSGFASCADTFSTASGRPGLCLEDLFVRPRFRRRGVGRALIRAVARRAVEAGCGGIEWQVGAGNEAALAAYASVGAMVRERVVLCRMDVAAVAALAASGPAAPAVAEARVIVIAGAPGAGKTTLINGLRATIAGPWVNIGKLRSFHLKPDWSDRHPAEEALGFDNLLYVVGNYVRHGYTDILVDDLRDHRVVQMPAALPGAEVRIVTLVAGDDDEIRRRIVERNAGFADTEEAAAWNRAVIERDAVPGEVKIDTLHKSPADVLGEALNALARPA